MARKQRPRTGEARKVRQPFAIDKLPSAWRDRIIALRAKWLTWEQIEQESTTWEWEKLDEELALSHFADKRIPHSTLHRWYDVQVSQKLEEIEAERAASLAVAAKFAGSGYKDLDESVKNALADVVFAHAKDSDAPAAFHKALAELAWILARNRQLDIAKQKVDVERMKVEEILRRAEKATNDAAKKIGKGGKLTIDDINRLRERTFGLPPIQRRTAAGPAA
jgi:hypothetical protein